MLTLHKKYTKPIIGIVLFLVLIVIFVEGVGLVENRQWAGNLTGMHHSSLAVGDINNDNKTDLILVGCTAGAVTSCTSVGAYVYTNNGTSLNYNLTWSQNLTAVGRSAIAIGDIDNDGDLDIIIAGSSDYSTADITRVYINNGTALVANQSWQLSISNANVYGGSIALGDVNNDGRLDLAISGADNSGYEGIYLNNGSSFNKDYTWTPSDFPNGGMSLGIMALSWVDLDGDSRLDLVVMGSYSTTFYANIYINNGTSLVQNTNWEGNLPAAFGWPSITFGDYDNDGDMDMAYMGTRTGDRLRIYTNDKTTFTLNQTETISDGIYLIGVFDGAVAFGDIDNDGDLDLTAIGKEIGRNRLYINSNGIFVEDTGSILNINSDNLQQGSSTFIDIDNDNDLDFISIGKIGDYSIMNATIYINNASLTVNNSIPYSPSTFQNYSVSNGNIFFGWNNGSDKETTSSGLYYNLRVGTASGGNDIISGIFGYSSRPTTGYFGNMMQRRNISLSGSRFSVNTTYYWSVQTIDTGLAKSDWSTEQAFTLTSDFTPPTISVNAPRDGLVTNQTLNILFNATVVDDYSVSNVSLYGNFNTTWHRNETNTSGINNTNYIFIKNLTEGTWFWGIRACDNLTNCRSSENYTIRIDTTLPIINLISPTNSTTQTSSTTVTFTYNVSDIAINNCSLLLNNAVQRTNTSITVNISQTFTETLSNGNYNGSVRCTDAANNINSSVTYKLTVCYTAPETPASSSGGGGSGGVATPANKVSRIIQEISTGNNLIEFTEKETATTGVEAILIDSASAARYVKISVEKLNNRPTGIESAPTKNVYTYLQIDKTILNDTDIKNAKIKFTVNKTWIKENNYDSEKIFLNRYTTKWERLPTKLLSGGSQFYYYESSSPGFSVFAITAEKKLEKAKELPQNEIEDEVQPPSEEKENVPQQEEMKNRKEMQYLVLVATIVAFALILLIKLKKGKPEKKLAFPLNL